METLLDSQYVVAGSNSGDHTTQQTKFINGRAVMMCNGAWMNNEMKTADAASKNFSIMKTPVISSIVDKLTDVKNDSTLSAVIAVVDQVVDGEVAIADVKQEDGTYKIGNKNICEADWNRVYEARTMIWENYSQHAVCIPNYASAKEGAKKFAAFFYSDEAQKLMNDATHMALPFNYNNAENEPKVSTWSTFERTMYEFSQKYNMIGMVDGRRSLVFTRGGATEYAMVNFVSAMSQQAGAKTADDIWGEVVGKLSENWNTYLSNAGLK
jgi:ABC-type glycerol-3-phosphate transport system substrate-binding protein